MPVKNCDYLQKHSQRVIPFKRYPIVRMSRNEAYSRYEANMGNLNASGRQTYQSPKQFQSQQQYQSQQQQRPETSEYRDSFFFEEKKMPSEMQQANNAYNASTRYASYIDKTQERYTTGYGYDTQPQYRQNQVKSYQQNQPMQQLYEQNQPRQMYNEGDFFAEPSMTPSRNTPKNWVGQTSPRNIYTSAGNFANGSHIGDIHNQSMYGRQQAQRHPEKNQSVQWFNCADDIDETRETPLLSPKPQRGLNLRRRHTSYRDAAPLSSEYPQVSSNMHVQTREELELCFSYDKSNILPPTRSIFDPAESYMPATNESAYGIRKTEHPYEELISKVDDWSKWVMVYGIPPSFVDVAISKYQEFGEIMNFHLSHGNWVLLEYRTSLQALKAIKSGRCVFLPGNKVMVSAKGVDPEYLSTLVVDHSYSRSVSKRDTPREDPIRSSVEDMFKGFDPHRKRRTDFSRVDDSDLLLVIPAQPKINIFVRFFRSIVSRFFPGYF